MTPARVVNRPSAASGNDCKPYQLEQIHAAGFTVPPTLVTTSPQAAREFVAQHGQHPDNWPAIVRDAPEFASTVSAAC